jgi:uncharacterized protein
MLMRGFLLLLATLAWTQVRAGTPLPDTPHIVVSGEGKTSIAPDSARVTFSFQQRAPRPLPAKQAVDSAVNGVLQGLGEYAIDDNDVSASSLTTREDVDYSDDGKRVSNGFVASREVTVVMRQLERLNDFLDAGLASGADDIDSIAFESTQADRLRAEARAEAVQGAQRRAAAMAAAFGASLGPVYSIDSVNSRHDARFAGRSLDRIEVTGSRLPGGRYLQPTVAFTESVSAVFELRR